MTVPRAQSPAAKTGVNFVWQRAIPVTRKMVPGTMVMVRLWNSPQISRQSNETGRQLHAMD